MQLNCRTLSLLILSSQLVGCVASNTVVEEALELRYSRANVKPTQLVCHTKIQILDQRNTNTIARFSNVKLTATKVIPWLEGSIRKHIPSTNLEIVDQADQSVQADVSISLKRLDAELVKGAFSAEVLLLVTRKGQKSVVARGSESSINWSSSSSEFRSLLNSALDQSLEKSLPTLIACTNTK